MTGFTYEKLNFLHRAAGRCCLLTLWIHAFGRIAMVNGLSRELWQQAYIYWVCLITESVCCLTAYRA